MNPDSVAGTTRREAMRPLTITQVAKQFGLRSSALRYYEQIGILLPANRVSGRRRYDGAALRRLAVIQRARQLGFSLEEIRELFAGFRPGTPASQRWRELSQRKLAQLEATVEHIMIMQKLLRQMGNCRCDVLDECGAGLLRNLCEAPASGRRASGKSRFSPRITDPS
jgi:MerR family redox-sensitive transcriptional activator SoxR